MKENERLPYLDSIRGLAASVVVLCHCYGLTAHEAVGKNPFAYVAAKFFMSARSSVMIFFVLSGFVLALSLLKHPIVYSAYAFRRFFRIYPAFLFAVLASFFIHKMIGVTHVTNSDFFNEASNVDTSLSRLFGHLAMLGTPQMNIRLNGVIWSLIHELRISFIFPLILVSLVKYRWRALCLWGLFSAACSLELANIGGDIKGFTEPTFIGSLIATGEFIIYFAAGAFLAMERKAVAAAVGKLASWKQGLLFLIIAALLLKSDYGADDFKSVLVDYSRGLSAVILIALALGVARFSKILGHAVLVWLGRISYSLYLIHVPIIFAVTQILGTGWPLLAESVLAITLALLVAELMARFIEFPSIALGKQVAQRLFHSQRN